MNMERIERIAFRTAVLSVAASAVLILLLVILIIIKALL